ncbi:MAG: 50S ribosomal protein L29 [Flavobacteriaceae bacterium]|jgi:large subunit ribosomal protein L29
MKQSEIKNLSVAELQEQLAQLKNSYAELKSTHAVSPIQNPLQIRSVRRSIARVATELTKRELQ